MYYSTPTADFWHWIAYIFEHFFLIPIDYLRHFQDQTWWGANLVNWVFISIIFVLFCYWLYKLNIFHDSDGKNGVPENYR